MGYNRGLPADYYNMTRRLLFFVVCCFILAFCIPLSSTVHATGMLTIPGTPPLAPIFLHAPPQSSSYFIKTNLSFLKKPDDPIPKQSPLPSPEPTLGILPTRASTPIKLDDRREFVGEYFDNASVSGAPVAIRPDNAIDFSWEWQPPIPEIAGTPYSVLWHKTESFTKGMYRFHVTASGGVRIFIDTVNIFDTSFPEESSIDIDTPITDGDHTIRVEFIAQSPKPAIHVTWENIPNPQPPEGYTGEYYDNQSLSGLPSLIRNDAAIDFDWGRLAPDKATQSDHFSVRWTRKYQFSGGTYRFLVTADDGVRLKIDGILYIDEWYTASESTHSTDVVLSGGTHTVILEYYDNTGNASVNFSWNVVATLPDAAFTAEYFSNTSLSGLPVYKASYPAVDFDWKDGSPDPQVPSDQFSARFSKTETFVGGNYRFLVTVDDGVRVLIDGKNILDAWKDESLATYTVFQTITAGTHTVIIEYYEAKGSAVLKTQWTKVDGASQEMFEASYFDNPVLKDPPMLHRKDELVDFDWDLGSPDDSIPDNNFSVRWTKTASFDGGLYRFDAASDDGIRVYLDDVPIIDQWNDHQKTSYGIDTQVASGNHTIRVEYYEHTGTALVRVHWTKI